MTTEQLEQWRSAKITSIPRGELVDIHTVRVDAFSPIETRMNSYLEQTQNPYCFLCGNIPVKLSFSGEEQTLQKRLTHYFVSRRQM